MIRRPPYPMRCPASASALGLAVAVSLGACGSTPNSFESPPSPARDEVGQRALPDEISREEIDRRGKTDPTAYALIQRLRPNWLLTRGQISITNPGAAYPVVYIDKIRHGGLMTLHEITPNQIQRMEFIRAADATTRWGTGHRSGVINVVTGR